MKTEVVGETSEFYQKEFREDIKHLSGLSPEKVEKLTEFIGSFDKLDELNEAKNWMAFSKEIGEPFDEVVKYIRPVQFIALASVNSKSKIEDILSDLSEVGIISQDKEEMLKSLITPAKSLMSKAFEKAAPYIPLLKIKSISSRCILVSEFDEEFSVKKHSKDSYQPTLSRLYPLVTLRLKFQDDEKEAIGIQLKKSDIDTLIKWLQLSKVQMEKMVQYGEENNLKIIYSRDE